jgi:hypothetical protein
MKARSQPFTKCSRVNTFQLAFAQKHIAAAEKTNQNKEKIRFYKVL